MECYVKGNSFQFLLETEGHTIWGISPVSCKNSYYLEILWNSRERAWGCKIPKVTVDQSDLVFSCPLLPEKEEEKRNYYRIPRWIFASETRVEKKRKKEKKQGLVYFELQDGSIKVTIVIPSTTTPTQGRCLSLHQVTHQDLNCPNCGVYALSKIQDDFRWNTGKL